MPKAPGLPTKPLEFNDFSGGITENILQGDPRRFEKGDNYFITVDHKLEERAGFLPDSDTSYLITGFEGQRINNYHLVHNDTVRVPQVSRALFYLNPSKQWTQILGVAGNQALSGGDQLTQTTLSEFQRVVYFASDYQNGVQPSKIYINESNAWTAKTAGLPRSWVTGNYTAASLLAKCITNANALRASMVAHFQDAKYATFHIPALREVSDTNLHINVDRYSLSYFQAVVFNIFDPRPSPIPTPLGSCTDQATMLALVGAINTSFTHHVGDAMLNSWGTQVGPATVTPTPKPNFHQDNGTYLYPFSTTDFPFQRPKGPGPALNATGAPTTVEDAATMLDDLLQKWNWHRKAVNTHSPSNDPAQFDQYAPVATSIGSIHVGTKFFPTITPDWTDIIGFANNLKYLYNSHVTNTPASFGIGGHKMRDNFIYNQGFECRLPDATDLDSAFLLIYWLRSLYQMHYYDAAFPVAQFLGVTFTSTTGSNALTAVTITATGGAIGAGFVGFFLETNGSLLLGTPNKYNGQATTAFTTARVTASGAGTLTLDSSVITGAVGSTGQLGIPMYHSSRTSFGGFIDNTVAANEQAADQLSDDVATVGTSTKTWMLLGQDLFFALASHMQYPINHLSGGASNFQNKILTVPNLPFYLPLPSTVSYAMFFQDRYKVEPNGIEYLVHGNPILSDSTEIAVSYPIGTTPVNLYPSFFLARPVTATRGNTLSNLPVLANDATTNYDTANVTLEIYRTTDGGQSYFFLKSLTNGTTSYLDIVNDTVEGIDGSASLDEGENIYTNGGVVGDDQPPLCKYTHILNGFTYYGGVVDAGQFFANRIRQSKENAPDAAPATFFDDLESPLVGISSARNNLISFCKNSVYRMAGQFDSQGKGQMSHENISDTLGCLNAKSIVRTEIGVFFAGTDGFYYTDGYQIINITLEWKNAYAKYTATEIQQRAIYGGYDTIQRRIWWAMKTGPYDADNSVVYVFYLNYGVKPSGVFTTISNGLNFRPSSLVIQKGQAYYAHEKGFLFKLDKWNKWDAEINELETADHWNHLAVPYHYRSIAVDMGSTFNRKWVTRIHLVGKNTGNMGVQTNAIRDLNEYNQGAVPLAPINYLQNVRWGRATCIWGDPTSVWKTDGKMDLWRRMPAGQLRSDFMQIEFKPANLCVYASQSDEWPIGAYARVTGSSTTHRTITLQTPAGYTNLVWPGDVVDYEIGFSFDGYVSRFLIESKVGNNITVADPTGILSVSANDYEWEIWGVKKEQRMTLTSYVLHYAYLGQANQSYPGATVTSGPGNAGQNV